MKTKLILRPAMAVVFLVAVAMSCKDRESEKRIAALESEIENLKGKKSGAQNEAPTFKPVNPDVNAATAKPDGPVAAISFPTKEYDFGTIKEGEVVEHSFEFTNTSDVPLIIANASPSCGCTVPDWTRDPIPAGGKGFVKAKFDSNGRPNLQVKTITVTANTSPKQTELKFRVMVKPKNPEPPAAGPLKQ